MKKFALFGVLVISVISANAQGTFINSFSLPLQPGWDYMIPYGLAFDGTNLRAAVHFSSVSPLSFTIAQITPFGALVSTSPAYDGGYAITYLAGQLFLQHPSYPGPVYDIVRFDPSTANLGAGFPTPMQEQFTSITSDGVNLIGTAADGTVFVMSPANGAVLRSFAASLDSAYFPGASAFYDGHLFLATVFDGVISQLDPTTGTRLGTYYTGLRNIRGMTFVGDYLFVADATTSRFYEYSLSSIPEPSGCSLLLLAVMVFGARRATKRRVREQENWG